METIIIHKKEEKEMMNNYDVVKMECSDVKFKNWAHTCIAKTSSLGTE